MNQERMIGSLITVIGSAALLGGSYVLAASSAGNGNGTQTGVEQSESRGDLPAGVRAQVTGTIVEWEREDNGYEVETRGEDGREREFHFDSKGNLSGYEAEDED